MHIEREYNLSNPLPTGYLPLRVYLLIGSSSLLRSLSLQSLSSTWRNNSIQRRYKSGYSLLILAIHPPFAFTSAISTTPILIDLLRDYDSPYTCIQLIYAALHMDRQPM